MNIFEQQSETEAILRHLGFPSSFVPQLYEIGMVNPDREFGANFTFKFTIPYRANTIDERTESLRKVVGTIFDELKQSQPIKSELDSRDREIRELKKQVEELLPYKTYFEKEKEIR